MSKHQGLYRMRSLLRVVLVADVGEHLDADPIDPEPRLEARSELRARARKSLRTLGADIDAPGAPLLLLDEHLYGDHLPVGTTQWRRRRVRDTRIK